MAELIEISGNISYLAASTKPLSSDVVVIKAKNATWIYDVGQCSDAAELINSIQGPKNIVISHFHADHVTNISAVKYDKLYVSPFTKKYTGSGNEIESETVIEDEPSITLIPVPSSHAKGCLALLCGDWCFMGDSTYCTEKRLAHSYNVQLLKQEIEVLENIPCKYFCLSHDRHFVQKKEDLILLHKQIYNRRELNNPLISVEDFFNPDGSVKLVD